MTHRKLILTVGFAMFAMFFGAGNLVFPLAVGAHAGHHLLLAMLGFTIAGVLVPFAGLFAITLYQGDYQAFLNVIGKRAGFIVSTLLIVLIGLIVGTPRCSVLAYNTMATFLPQTKASAYIFNAVFFTLIYFACVKKNKVVDLLGYILSPLKLGLLLIVIIVGLAVSGEVSHSMVTGKLVLWHAMIAGYGTMDLLAAFFFCAFVYRFIEYRTRAMNITADARMWLVLKACLVGAALLAIIYLCFIIVAHEHSAVLQRAPTQALIGVIAKALLNSYAALFVAVCVGLACFSTAIAVTTITVDFIHHKFLQRYTSYKTTLLLIVIIVFIMSNLGFTWLMALAVPALTILYPALLMLTICNIIYKLGGVNLGKPLFYVTVAVTIGMKLI